MRRLARSVVVARALELLQRGDDVSTMQRIEYMARQLWRDGVLHSAELDLQHITALAVAVRELLEEAAGEDHERVTADKGVGTSSP